MNLSPARLVVLVALVVGGLAVMINGFGDDATVLAGGGGLPTPSVTESPQPTDGASPSPSETDAPALEPQVDGVAIQVLNGTGAVGLAAEVEALLVGKGYVAELPATDATNKPANDTIVYFRTGPDAEQNEIDAQNLADRYLKSVEARVESLSNAVDANKISARTQLVVLLGEDYATANPVTEA